MGMEQRRESGLFDDDRGHENMILVINGIANEVV